MSSSGSTLCRTTCGAAGEGVICAASTALSRGAAAVSGSGSRSGPHGAAADGVLYACAWITWMLTRNFHPLKGRDVHRFSTTVANATQTGIGERTHAVEVQEEEAAVAAAKSAKQAGKKAQKPKKAAKKAAKTAARANSTREAEAAEQPSAQHPAPCEGALQDLQPWPQPDADAGVQAPSYAADEADDSWQLCPLSKVGYVMLQMCRVCPCW